MASRVNSVFRAAMRCSLDMPASDRCRMPTI